MQRSFRLIAFLALGAMLALAVAGAARTLTLIQSQPLAPVAPPRQVVAQPIAAGVTPWPMGEGVTCYTYLSALACVQIQAQAIASATPTLPAPSPTRPPATITASPTLPATATRPPASPTAPIQLVNGGFEDGFTGWTHLPLPRQNANGQNAVAGVLIESLSSGSHPAGIHGGEKSLRLLTERQCFTSVVAQKVAMPIGTRFRLSAWSRVWARDDPGGPSFPFPSEPNLNSTLAIGVDPKGRTDPTLNTVSWKTRVGTGTYTELALEEVAEANTVTLYLAANLGNTNLFGLDCMWPYWRLVAHLDEARLEVLP